MTKKPTKPSNTDGSSTNSKGIQAYFSPGPALSTARIKNSRSAQIARNKNRPTKEGLQSITFTHKTRFEVNLPLSASSQESRTTELLQLIDELIGPIIKADPKAKLLPWRAKHQKQHPAIGSTDETTGSFADIYLSRSWLGQLDKKHRFFFKMHIGHDREYGEYILPATDDWNTYNDRKFEHCMIQAEDTDFIGWFLYSTHNIDAGSLSDAIYDMLGLEVGLRWMEIRMSRQSSNNKMNKKDAVKALHVEVEKAKGRSVTEQLMKCYGRKFTASEKFPNGIRLRFCKNISNAAYKDERTKLMKFRSRQEQLTKETSKAASAGILDIDTIIFNKEVDVGADTPAIESTTLRQAIMEIKSREVKDTLLFTSVDMSYNSEEFLFAYHNSMADEARAMVDYLYPYLLHLYPQRLLKKAFDPTHIKEMTSFQYNQSTDCVEDVVAEAAYRNMDTDTMAGNIEFAAFDLSEMELTGKNEDDSLRPAASVLQKVYAETDSLSTQKHGTGRRNNNTETSDMLEVTETELNELQREIILQSQTKHRTSARKGTIHIPNLDTKTTLANIRRKRLEATARSTINITDDDENDDKKSKAEIDENEEEEKEDVEFEGYEVENEELGEDEELKEGTSESADMEDDEIEDNEDMEEEYGTADEVDGSDEDEDMEASSPATNTSQELDNDEASHSQEVISQPPLSDNEPPTSTEEGGEGL